MHSPSEPRPDAWANHDARALLADLADRGVVVTVAAGRLDVRPASRLTPGDVAQLRRHRLDLLVLVLACDERTLDRLLDLRRAAQRGTPRAVPATQTPGACYACREPLPAHRARGRCGWCALAGRQYAGAPLTADVLRTFDEALVGAHAQPEADDDAPPTSPRLDLDGAA